MKSYVINLEKDAERREYMRRLLVSTPFADAEFVNAVDGRAMTAEQLSAAFDYEMYGRVHMAPPSAGEVGCALSHRSCWERVASVGEPAFVMEDDIELEWPLDEVAEFAASWLDSPKPRVLNLTRNCFYFALQRVGVSRPVRAYQCYNAWCYGINAAAARILLSRPPHTLSDEWGYFRRWGVDVRVPVPHPVVVRDDSPSSIGEHYCDRFDRDGVRRSVLPGMMHYNYLPNLLLTILSKVGVFRKYTL